MKKYLLLAVCAFFLVSCHRTEISHNEWIYSLEEAEQAAQNSDRKILLFFSSENDGFSPRLKQNIFSTDEFKKNFSDKYVFLNLDLSEDSTDANNFATKIGVQVLPSFYVLSKEGYLVSNIFFESEFKTVEEFKVVFEQFLPQFDLFENLMENIKNSSGLNRVKAIDALFQNTAENGRILLYPLFSEILSLDPKNETGLIGSYIIACTNKRAVDYSLNGDNENASREFLKIYDTAIFTTEEKQSCLFMAVVILLNMEKPDFERIVGYLKQIHDMNPNNHLGTRASEFITKLEQMANK